MKFSTRTDIAASAETVFQEVSNFSKFENLAKRRGATIKRGPSNETKPASAMWDVSFPYRGKKRSFHFAVQKYVVNEELFVFGEGKTGIDVEVSLDVVELGKQRSRLRVGINLRPKSLPARVLIQSMKFSKGRLDKKFQARVIAFGNDIEQSAGGTKL